MRVCPDVVGLGRRPFRLAVNGQAQAKMRRSSAPFRPVTHVPEHLPGEKGASSALRHLSQAVYGLAPWAPTILGHTPFALMHPSGQLGRVEV